MDETKLRTIAQLQEFLDATPEVKFTLAAGTGDAQRYEHISRVLKRFDYPRLKKAERGVVLAYLRHTSAYSRPQITRLVARWEENRLAPVPLVKRYRAPAAPFARKYTAVDVALLAQVDRANEDVCGPAIAHLLRRAYTVYGDKDYKRASVQRRMVARQPHVGRPGQRWLLSRRAVGRAMSATRRIILAGGAGTRLHPLTLTVQQATAAGLSQDDDLLPAVGTDAGRHPRGVADQHPARSSAALGPAR